MSMRQNHAGQKYVADKIDNLAVQDLYWSEPYNQDISELTVVSRGIKKTYTINNLDLENTQRRSCLHQIAEPISQRVF